MYTCSASFRRNAGSEPVFGHSRALRRNTVTSPRKRDACRTLATRADSKPYRDPLHGKEAQKGTRGIDRCGAVLTDDAGPVFRGVPEAFSPITHQRRGPQLRSPAYSAG